MGEEDAVTKEKLVVPAVVEWVWADGATCMMRQHALHSAFIIIFFFFYIFLASRKHFHAHRSFFNGTHLHTRSKMHTEIRKHIHTHTYVSRIKLPMKTQLNFQRKSMTEPLRALWIMHGTCTYTNTRCNNRFVCMCKCVHTWMYASIYIVMCIYSFLFNVKTRSIERQQNAFAEMSACSISISSININSLTANYITNERYMYIVPYS